MLETIAVRGNFNALPCAPRHTIQKSFMPVKRESHANFPLGKLQRILVFVKSLSLYLVSASVDEWHFKYCFQTFSLLLLFVQNHLFIACMQSGSHWPVSFLPASQNLKTYDFVSENDPFSRKFCYCNRRRICGFCLINHVNLKRLFTYI